jgi:hypothetical protein
MLPPLLDSCGVLCPPASADDPPAHLVRGKLRYMHYNAQDFADRGWGCGFRTTQTMLSWLEPRWPPPTIPECQAAIPGYAGPREWMGVPDAVALLDCFHASPVLVRHLPARRSAGAVGALVAELARHFDSGGGPIMVAGGVDVYSKTVVGVRGVGYGAELLVWDPHYSGTATARAHEPGVVGEAARRQLWDGGWVAWRSVSALRDDSFYNLGLPRPRPAESTAPPAATSRAGEGGAALPSSLAGDWSGVIELVESGVSASTECAETLIEAEDRSQMGCRVGEVRGELLFHQLGQCERRRTLAAIGLQ